MKFLDECLVKVQAGKGGDGVISFRREFRVDKGGPDGGDGGNGGSIFFVGHGGTNTLYKIKFQKHIHGNDGENGRRKNQYGANGEDVFIKVPLGTLVYNGDDLLMDIVEEKPYLVASGGRGGRGNMKFKSAKNTVPRLSENGEPGQAFELRLSLKVLADIGFVGKPSAGKSTILSKISNAKPKIADYPFTTLAPQLGIAYIDEESFVAADLPGLIKGASQGKGLGHEFLKHIERCKVIAHIIDFGSDEKNPIIDFEEINHELQTYSLGLETRKQVVIANKMDMQEFKNNLSKFKEKFPSISVVEISAIEEKNIDNLKRALLNALQTAQEIVYETKVTEVTIKFDDQILISSPFRGMFEVEGNEVKKWYNKIPLNSTENFRRFNKMMKEIGVWSALQEKGIKNGDTVRIYSYEFTWDDEEW